MMSHSLTQMLPDAKPATHVVAVIPAYNEERTIHQVADETLKYVSNVIVVDDGSTDGTSDVLVGFPITVLRNEVNQGKAGALWQGMQRALKDGATAVITLDGDGQHNAEDIPKLITAHLSAPNTLVLGARRLTDENAPRARRFANRFADFWISWAAGHWVLDSQSGFRLYPADLIKQLAVRHDKVRGFVFESEAVIEAARSGFRTTAVVVPAVYPASARPSHFRPVRDIARIVLMVAWKLITRALYLTGLFRALRECWCSQSGEKTLGETTR